MLKDDVVAEGENKEEGPVQPDNARTGENKIYDFLHCKSLSAVLMPKKRSKFLTIIINAEETNQSYFDVVNLCAKLLFQKTAKW